MTIGRPPSNGPLGLQLPPGLSGARVSLVSPDGRHWFVRKAAASASGSERLRGQAAKQRRFAAAAAGVLRTPAILDEREIDGVFSFDMEYVPGWDAASFLAQADYQQVSRFADRLTAYLRRAAAAPTLSNTRDPLARVEPMLAAKLAEIQERCATVPESLSHSLARSLASTRHLEPLSATLCHGDLTLENIVVTYEEEIFVLDLLDAPVEHYWQDLSKLHQDLAAGWYARSLPAIAPAVLDFLCAALRRTADALDPRYARLHFLLLAINLLRILPYVTSPSDRDFVLARASHFAAKAEETARDR